MICANEFVWWDLNVMSMWCQCDVNMMSLWCQYDVNLMSIWCQCDVNMMSIWCQYDVNVMSMQCQCDINVMSCKCHVNVMLMSCRCQCHVDVMSMSCPWNVNACKCHVNVMSMWMSCRNLSSVGLRPSTLPLGHEGFHNIKSLWVSGEETFCIFENWMPERGTSRRPSTFQAGRFNHCNRAPVAPFVEHALSILISNHCVVDTTLAVKMTLSYETLRCQEVLALTDLGTWPLTSR